MTAILTGENISFTYKYAKILKDVTVNFEKGQIHAIIGPSGSGKTTLLAVLSGLSTYQEGSVRYKGTELNKIKKTNYRNETSNIFQNYNLITYLSALQNIIVAMDISRRKGKNLLKAKALLTEVGINEADWYRPAAQLSGGQQQRVAIARALATDSEIIFADEPTGNLDSKTGESIIQLLCRLAHDHQKCVICVTHDQEFQQKADVVYSLRDGTIV